MVRHHCERAERIMPEPFACQHRIDDYTSDIRSFKIVWTSSRGVKVAIDPDECFSAGDFARRREAGRRQASVQMPSDEQPFVFRTPMRQPPSSELHTEMVGKETKTSHISIVPGVSTSPCAGVSRKSPCPIVS